MIDACLTERSVLVTGASGGIGQAICRAFIDQSARVIAHYHQNPDGVAQLRNGQPPEQVLAIGADLTNEAQVDELFAQAEQLFGNVSILVANAGIWPAEPVDVHLMSLQRWQHTIETNLTSVFLCVRRFLRGVLQHQIIDPAIVMIGSTAAIFGEAGHADYAASKSPLCSGLLLSLKNEISRIAPLGRVNTIAPGWTVTPMTRDALSPESLAHALATVPMQKVATPEDIAWATVFLTSTKLAGHITGQCLTISGGMEGRVLT